MLTPRSRVTKCQHETQSSIQECRVGVYAMLSNVLHTDALYAISMNKDIVGWRHLAAWDSGNMISNNNSSCSQQTKFNLVQVKGTWIRQSDQFQLAEGKLSDAKM